MAREEVENERSLFITLEGPEGSGKTSQIHPFTSYLKQRWDLAVINNREPGSTDIGTQIRSVLLDLNNTAICARTEILLFLAARAQNVEEVLKPALAKGICVLGDRYGDSTMAYQGFGHGTDLNTLVGLNQFATAGLIPDLTLLLDIDPEKGLQRRRSSNGEWNRLDAVALSFHQRVRCGYLELARQYPHRIKIIDASQGFSQVQEQMRAVFESFMEIKGRALLGLAGRFE